MTRLVALGLCGLLATAETVQASNSIASSLPRITFEQRVMAQRAIERVYHEHQIGGSLPFDEAVPDELLEKKVRLYLRQSAALASLWNTTVTAEMLRAEWERIARSTRMPGRLDELHAALDDDPILIQECLVRPVLVDRLARNFFSHDRDIHAGARRRAEEVHERLSHGLGETSAASFMRSVADIIRDDAEHSPVPPGQVTLESSEFDRMRAGLPSTPGEVQLPEETSDAFIIRTLVDEEPDRLRVATWRIEKRSWDDWWLSIQDSLDEASIAIAANGDLPSPATASVGTGCANSWSESLIGGPPRPRASHAAVWTGNLMVVWGGEGGWSTGGRYDPATDTWTPTTLVGAPEGPRSGVTAVWTGSLMVVWGGNLFDNTGGRYDPVNDRWLPVSLANAPGPRAFHTAVWTGSEMLVWGGVDGLSNLATGGRYDPISNSWSPISMNGAPSPRQTHTAVWTGSRMVVWGGRGETAYLGDGGRYDPVSDTWTPVAISGAPTGRSHHSAVFDGSRIIVWGGWNAVSYFGNGARYDPAGDSWSSITTTGAPPPRRSHTAVWTGSRMIIWGGVGSTGSSGFQYDPVINQWTGSSFAEPVRHSHTAVWTGSRMIVWGGYEDLGPLVQPSSRGVSYDPVTDTVTPTSSGEAAAFGDAPAVWTGNLMVLWGWYDANGTFQAKGARYDPVTDSWSPTSEIGSPPSPRAGYTLVWTGNSMIVWGGRDHLGTFLNSGSRYDPLADAWMPTSPFDAPDGRVDHSAVWTGSVMVVWGGFTTAGGFSELLNTGGRYDPSTGRWDPTSLTGAPDGRTGHTAVWTGSRMIVWGGSSYTRLNTGGRYDPSADRWDPMSLAGAPDGRVDHSAVWTGSRMIVWGGNADPLTGIHTRTGGRYDPSSDAWLATSTFGAPSGRDHHTATWLNDRMLVWGGGGSPPDPPVLLGGGLYDPSSDSWDSASIENAPPPMRFHVALSLGDSMLVRGRDFAYHAISGGLYFPGAIDSDADEDGASLCDDCDDVNPAIYPGAAQICDDGVNNDCLSLSWPSLAETNEVDDDGDAYSECTGDCSDTDASNWAFPSEVAVLDLMADAETLIWTAPSSPGGSTVRYDTLRSSAGSDFGAAVCVETTELSDLMAHDPLDPPLRGVFFYSIRALNGCGSGPLGFDSAGRERSGRLCPSTCGNNVREGPESCDGSDLGGETCQGHGHGGGSLACNATCDGFQVSGCSTCGNNVREGSESCDGSDLGGETCQSHGHGGGSLACNATCDGFQVSGCSTCGNNVREGGEVCDGTDLGGQTCNSQGYPVGTLVCWPTCNGFDVTGCEGL